ncbi:MAG: helix-turn-helix transcriptional regulator [Clostridia bacterium]|nr:helix-turn-helix transcriptional regulator [Clostridia bacterium]
MVQRSFQVFGLGPVTVTYTEREYAATDSRIVLYHEPKISIHLTDGLYGVIGDRLVGGERGDVSLYAPNEVHFGRFSTGGRFRFLHIFPSREFLRRVEGEYPPVAKLFSTEEPGRTNCIRGSYEEKTRILEIAETLADFAKGKGDCHALGAFSVLLELLLLLTALSSQSQGMPPLPLGTPIVQRTVEYITGNYQERLTVSQLAHTAGCSAAYLSRTFKAYMGRSVYQYLTEYRVHRAAALLNTGCSVTEACYRVGFSDCSAFIRTFRRILGVTPYQYKQSPRAPVAPSDR